MITISLRKLTSTAVGDRVIFNPYDITGWDLSFSERGSAKATFNLTLRRNDLLWVYGSDQVFDVSAFVKGRRIFRGRTEGVKITGGKVQITALGYSRSYSDNSVWIPVSIDRDYSRLFPLNPTVSTAGALGHTKYNIDFNNRIYASLKKNQTYTNAVVDVRTAFKPYPRAGLGWNGFQFAYRYQLPTNWRFRFETLTENLNTPASVFEEVSAGVLRSGAASVFLGGTSASFDFAVYNSTGGNYTNTLEDDVWFFEVTALRAVTMRSRAINTTLTANVAAGANVLITVASTANMYVGQDIVLNNVGTPSELTQVLSIVSATQFRANLVNPYTSGQSVRGLASYPDEVIDYIMTFNGADTPLDPSNVEITNNPLDLHNFVRYGKPRESIIKELAALGGVNSEEWTYYVTDDLVTHYKPTQNVSDRVWLLYLSELELQRLLESVGTVGLVHFKTSLGTDIRTFGVIDPDAEALYGIRRLVTTNLDTTSETEANLVRAKLLADKSAMSAQTTIRVAYATSDAGAQAQLFDIKPYDMCVISNLPLTVSPTINKIRSFRVSEVSVNAKGDLKIIPDLPIPSLEFMLTRRSYGY